MEALAAVSQRMGEIESRLAMLGYGRAPGGVLGGPASVTSAVAAGAAGSAGATGTTGALSFDQALAAELTATTDVGGGRSLVDAKGVPLELRQYGNGTVPAEALSAVDGVSGHRLWAPAARSLEAMRAAAARDGVTIGVTDSYRTLATQEDLVARKGLYSQGGLAAKPGTSMHGWGVAVDLKLDAAAQQWMRTHGGQYGFVEDTPREPWHWGYHPTH